MILMFLEVTLNLIMYITLDTICKTASVYKHYAVTHRKDTNASLYSLNDQQ